MKIAFIFPYLPPARDGIGDYISQLAKTLSQISDHELHILTSTEQRPAPIPNVTIHPCFSVNPINATLHLLPTLQTLKPDWVILQFNQFSYGRWGFNPFLPYTLFRVRKACPNTHIALMAHEDFVPVTSFKNAIITTWQRAQLWSLGQLSEHIFFSIEPWTKKYKTWFPHAPVTHLPVSSNLPHQEISKAEARRTLKIPESTFVLGFFGNLHVSKLPTWTVALAQALFQRKKDFLLLYAGPEGTQLQNQLLDIPFRDLGYQPPEAISTFFASLDLMSMPFIDGVSTRRGSFMAALQHGVPTLSTQGPLTDTMLREQNKQAFWLTPTEHLQQFVEAGITLYLEPQIRNELGQTGQVFFQRYFTWQHIAHKFLQAIQMTDLTPA